ncbi:MAG TPA: hypothetical protein VK851_04440 [Anaerolineales bacterium]|nr:hypothetical protein [Anaerolineales bacterium]
MPIVDIEIVLKPSETLRESLVSDIADALGKIFNSPQGGTWVKLHELSSDNYAENDEEQNSVHPIFVRIIKSQLPDAAVLQTEAEELSNTIALICGRPPENVHTIFEPQGTGRVAFGGKVVS